MLAFSRRPQEASSGRDALEDLFAHYRPRVLGLCRRMLNDPDAAEDACQEALTRVYEALPRFREGAAMWPWIATITANVCRDVLRRDRWTEPIESADLVEPGPEQHAATRARARLVHDAVASLPAAYRAPLYLRELEGWKCSQIAELRGRSLASVRTNLMRGRRVLAERIEELARERRDWPLAGVGLGVAAFRRLRARVLARLQGPVDAVAASAARLDSVVATLASAPLSVMAPVAAAAALVSLAFLPAAPVSVAASPEASQAVPARMAVAGVRSGAGVSAAPVDPPGRAAESEPEARVEAPGMELATPAPTEDTPGADNDQNVTIEIGPTGVYCGAEREDLTVLLCEVLDP